jgi:hypothetical protein
MSTTDAAGESEDRGGEERVTTLTRSSSSNPPSWALQFGITASSSAGDTHPLMADPHLPQRFPPRPSTLDSSTGVETDYLSSADTAGPATSASSAASMTSSPGPLSRFPPQRPPDMRQDESVWDENSFDDHQSSVTFNKLMISEASSDLGSLKRLMRQGSWRAIVDMVKEVRRSSSLQAPDEQIVYSMYYVLALMKLRNYAAAQDEFSVLGDLNSPNFRFEKHANFYPNKSGSMVPLG